MIVLKHIALLFFLIFFNKAYGAENSTVIQDTNDKDFKALKLKRPAPDYSLNQKDELSEKNLTMEVVDETMGIRLGNYHTKDDKTRMSLLYHINADLKDMFQVTSFELIYAKKQDSFWLEGSVSLNNAIFGEVSENNGIALGETTEDTLLNSTSILVFAAGVSYRTTLIQEILQTSDYFETISALASYNIFSDPTTGFGFRGIGMKADLGIHKRLTPNYHLGVRASYVLASVKRASEEEGETTAQRSLTLHWITLGADVTFYF